jgi:hypothetical protein
MQTGGGAAGKKIAKKPRMQTFPEAGIEAYWEGK